MMAGPAGLLAGPVAMVATGAVLLVLAQGRHCVTSHWGVADGASLANPLDECVQTAADLNAPHGAAPLSCSMWCSASAPDPASHRRSA